MDAVPIEFYDKVAQTLCSSELLTECGALSGVIGAVAKDHLDNDAMYVIVVNNGMLEDAWLLSMYRNRENGSPLQIEETTNKYLNRGVVLLRDTPLEEPEEDPSSDCKVPDFINSTNTVLYLNSPMISKRTERLVQSIKCVSFLTIRAPITEETQKILEIAVQKKTLNYISFACDHEFNEFSTKALLALLKQDQFYLADLSEKCRLSLDEVIAEWKLSSHKMIRKNLVHKANLEDQIKSQFGFTELNGKKIVLRGQGGRNVYADFDHNGPHKTKIFFA